MCILLIKMGADVHAKNHGGNQAMHAAFRYKCKNCVKALYAKGARVLDTNEQGEAPLAFSDEKFLLECGLGGFKAQMEKEIRKKLG